MGNKTIDLYFIQSPAFLNANAKGYAEDLLTYYDNSIEIKNIYEFIFRVNAEVGVRQALIKKLVIGSHGWGTPNGHGLFNIGQDIIDKDSKKQLDSLRPLAGLFAKDADVFIMACRTGQATMLLTKLSQIWGGVPVHGYTGDIFTSSFWRWASVDPEGEEIVCLPGFCIGSNRIIMNKPD